MSNPYNIYTYTPNDGYERGYFQPIEIPFDDTTDYYFTIPEKYNQKPGNMAYELYGDARLYWIFTYFNQDQIEDPIFGVRAGLTIRVPDKQRLLNFF